MKILSVIVDDDDLVIYLHKVVLEEAGFNAEDIFTAINGKEALEVLNQSVQDDYNKCIIFLDINMPVMDGWEFLEEMKNRIHTIPTFIVMVTSSVNIEDREKAKSVNNVIDYIEKPLTISKAENVLKLFKDI